MAVREEARQHVVALRVGLHHLRPGGVLRRGVALPAELRGYVYYGVGLVVTALVGRYCIVALNRRLAQQALIEQQPDDIRRNELAYDVALARLSKGVCPGCERPVDLKGTDNAFCPHCGIGLFNNCGQCAARKNTFSPFCHACGTPAVAGQA